MTPFDYIKTEINKENKFCISFQKQLTELLILGEFGEAKAMLDTIIYSLTRIEILKDIQQTLRAKEDKK
jgi:hypothetical protein